MLPTTPATAHPITTTLLRPIGGAGLMTSRKETALCYLRTTEAEYLTCQLRLQIYTRERDRDYYTRVLAHKKATVERVAARELLASIFTDPALMDDAHAKLYGAGGLPNFHYKDYSDKQKFAESDKRNYFQPGRAVRLSDGTAGRCAGLTDDGRVRVRVKGQSRKAPTKPYPAEWVTRTFVEAPGELAAEPAAAVELETEAVTV